MKGKSRRAAISAIDKATGQPVKFYLDHLKQTIDGIPMDLDGNLIDPDKAALLYYDKGYDFVKASWRL